MTDRRTAGSPEPCGTDIAAFALGALDRAEADVFACHLRRCAVCRDELCSFEQVVDLLAVSTVRLLVPGRVRRRVLGAVRRASRERLRRRRRDILASARPAIAMGERVAGALLIVAAVAVTIRVLGTSSAPPARVYDAHVTGAAGSAQLRDRDGRADLLVRGIAAPSPGRIYQVWLVRGSGRPQPTRALFGVTTRGDADVEVPGSLNGVRRVLVTAEPAGGSATPTRLPVITSAVP